MKLRYVFLDCNDDRHICVDRVKDLHQLCSLGSKNGDLVGTAPCQLPFLTIFLSSHKKIMLEFVSAAFQKSLRILAVLKVLFHRSFVDARLCSAKKLGDGLFPICFSDVLVADTNYGQHWATALYRSQGTHHSTHHQT